MRYKDRLPWQLCRGGLFFIAVTPPCTTKGHNKGVRHLVKLRSQIRGSGTLSN